MPRASSLEAELREKFGADVTLVPGTGGVLEVTADGREVFSKAKMGRFPEPGEIEALLRRR
ncbi:MAG: Rdx family protein [Desulfobacteraceae bacterium]|nr:Rdx family protein [Desulfobacteraceae bacterium]